MMNGKYLVLVIDRGIPASDCAAEFVAVGSEVKDFSVGDRVTPIFDLNCITGSEDASQALGGDVDGVLRQYAVFDQNCVGPLAQASFLGGGGFAFHCPMHDKLLTPSHRRPVLPAQEPLHG